MKNQFFDAELAGWIAARDRIEMLARKIDGHPELMLSLELEEIEQLNLYYYKLIRQKEEELEYLKNATS